MLMLFSRGWLISLVNMGLLPSLLLLLYSSNVLAEQGKITRAFQRDYSSVGAAFVAPLQSFRSKERVDTFELFLAKGFNKARNKQADLARKLALAKQEKQSTVVDPTKTSNTTGSGDKKAENKNEPKSKTELEDRQQFEKLLLTTKGAIPTDDDTDSAFIAPMKAGHSGKTKKKKGPPPPPPAPKKRKKKEDKKVAQRHFFESLVDVASSNTLGPIGAAQLVPWVPPYLTDCLVVFADPRTQSGDLRQTLKYLTSNLQDEKQTQQVIFITAEPAQETSAWLQRNGITTPIRIFSDSSSLEWMTQYKLIGDDEEVDQRWSMSMLIFDTKGRIPKLIRNVDPSHATQMTLDTMKEVASQS